MPGGKHMEAARRLHAKFGAGNIKEGDEGPSTGFAMFHTPEGVRVEVFNRVGGGGSRIAMSSWKGEPALRVELLKDVLSQRTGKNETTANFGLGGEVHIDNITPHFFELLVAAKGELANLD